MGVSMESKKLKNGRISCKHKRTIRRSCNFLEGIRFKREKYIYGDFWKIAIKKYLIYHGNPEGGLDFTYSREMCFQKKMPCLGIFC